MPEGPKERGIWAEHYVRDFLSLPFISEFVFHSLQTIDGTQKEVADFLIAYSNVAVLISQKTQKDPLARNAEKTASWALKEAKKAASQLCGALRTGRDKSIWCEHLRRGRVELPSGLPAITHGIVLVEVLERVDLNAQAADLPLMYQGTPITYLSLNDFLNIAIELRTVPEVLAYLDAREGSRLLIFGSSVMSGHYSSFTCFTTAPSPVAPVRRTRRSQSPRAAMNCNAL